MENIFYTQIIPLILAGLPTSLFLVKIFTKIFSKNNPELGKTTTICTTIFGTLTKKELQVKHVVCNKYEIMTQEKKSVVNLENLETKEESSIEKTELRTDDHFKLMATTTTLCHYPKIHKIESIISNFFKTCAIDSHVIRETFETISQIPSNEEKKISTIVAINKKTNEIFSYTKGNPYRVLARCKRILIDDKKLDIDSQLRRKIKIKIERLNKIGEKIIAFAYKPLPKKRLDNYSEQFTENDLVFIGMIGVGHYMNTELIPTIEKIKKNGIKIYILSSITERKTVATARELKIVNPKYFESITKKDLEDLNDQKLRKILSNKEKDYTFSELKKSDKFRIIRALTEQGEIIAMADKRPRNSIKHVFENIRQERQRQRNQRKLIFHTITCKITEVILIIAAIALKAPVPLSIALILFIDIFINTPIELSLHKDPIKKIRITKNHIIISGIFTGILITGLYFWSIFRFGWFPGETLELSEFALTISATTIFVLISLIQILRAFLIKKKHPFVNRYLILTSIIALMLIYIATQFPFFQKQLSLTSISNIDWQLVIFLLIIVTIFHAIFKNKSHPEKPKE